jgi:hypothetical protein
LGERDYEHFFSVAHRLERLHGLEAHHAIRQFVSLIEITRLLHESGAFDDKAAAEIFRFVCDQFAAAHEGAGYSRAALTVLHRLAPAHGALVDQLLPTTGPVSFEFQGQTRTFDY